MNSTSIGKNIKRLRIQKGNTQEQLAERLCSFLHKVAVYWLGHIPRLSELGLCDLLCNQVQIETL